MHPIDQMRTRLSATRADSDVALFYELLYYGELVVKLSTVGMLAALYEDQDRHRYRVEYGLIRSDGIGEWVAALDDVIQGPASQQLRRDGRTEQREITERFAPADGTWQGKAVETMRQVCRIVDHNYEQLPGKYSLRMWFQDFAWLRNKTRGHGAITTKKCADACVPLDESVEHVARNFHLFKRSWSYLYRNLSGKYRVGNLVEQATGFDYLKRDRSVHLADGLYVWFGEPCQIRLVGTDVDLADFFIANGAFDGDMYEVLSYSSGERQRCSASEFLLPPTSLPPSETHGARGLDVQGASFGNLPPELQDYVERRALQNELAALLRDDRHPVVTLAGRGGIGKTSLALKVLHDLADAGDCFAIVWFSARDIDLLPQGPKVVRPAVLTAEDVAKEYCALVDPALSTTPGFRPTQYFEDVLAGKESTGSLLLAFDNFETLRNPADVYAWIDTHVRLPNKIVITTRLSREFKGDYWVEVGGMTYDEFEVLAQSTAKSLGIEKLLTRRWLDELYEESDGHPYVVKVLLSEVAKRGTLGKVERIMADKDAILEALFERTFSGLSPAADRVFLTLCTWRSVVAFTALRAVLLHPRNERMDVNAAIDELRRSSLLEVITSQDGEEFLVVPFTASTFGRRKLAVSPIKSAIDTDSEALRLFGAAQEADIQHGLGPRVERFFRNVATQLQESKREFSRYEPILKYVVRRYPRGWLLLADLYEQQTIGENWIAKAADCVRRYLEVQTDDWSAWRRLAALSERLGDRLGQVNALVQGSMQPGAAYIDISYAANTLSRLLSEGGLAVERSQQNVLVRQLLGALEHRVDEADATDCSRIAWLCLRLSEKEKAQKYVRMGLDKDPSNTYCVRLGERLGVR